MGFSQATTAGRAQAAITGRHKAAAGPQARNNNLQAAMKFTLSPPTFSKFNLPP
jgi:hypothetical protein